MPSLIHDLQRSALDDQISVTKLLRMSKVVATKLELKEFLLWVQSELDGWEKECPAYRKISGQIKVWNPYRGWQPLNFTDAAVAKSYSSRFIGQKVGELEAIQLSGSQILQVPFPPELANHLVSLMDVPLQPTLQINVVSVTGILDSVRNIILDWSLKLEQNGIIGDGLSFSASDKQRAHDPQVAYYIDRIENFTGSIGSVSGDVRADSRQS